MKTPAACGVQVEEAAGVALMLACNGHIPSQTINVNGGWYMS